MRKEAGLWIDHRKAVIVILTGGGDGIKGIKSNVEKQIRFSSGTSLDGLEEGTQKRPYPGFLNSYYREVIACIRDAQTIQIFGSGEVVLELEKRLKQEDPSARIIGVETDERMTDGQVEVKVRQHFLGL